MAYKAFVTKMYHRDTAFFRKGESFTVVARFASFEDAQELLRSHNDGHANANYHFTGFYQLDAQGRYAADFCMFDISDIWDAYGLTGADMRHKRSWEPGADRFNRKLNELLRTLSAYAGRRPTAGIRAQIEELCA